MERPYIAISSFVRRQTKESEFSNFEGTDEELLSRVLRNFDKAEDGYRDGVKLVPVEPQSFYTSLVILKEGDVLAGKYEARQASEEPRKKIWVVRDAPKAPAAAVDIVLYRSDVLKENNERSTDADWEIISINARPTKEKQPISVGALMANHFQISGGTATNMTDQEFVEKLKESFLYWRDKSLSVVG